MSFFDSAGKFIEGLPVGLVSDVPGQKPTLCADPVDAKYVQIDGNGILTGKPGGISAKVSATSRTGALVTNGEQTFALGQYKELSGVLKLPFENNVLATRSNFTFNHQAWDFVPMPTTKLPYVEGAPVELPPGNVTWFENEANNITNAIAIYNPNTGFLTAIGHTLDTVSYIEKKYADREYCR